MKGVTVNAERVDLVEPSIIKTEEQYRQALAAVEQLASEDPPADSPAGARLELLAKLVEDYEKTRYPFAQPDPVDAIVFRMEQQGLRQKDLAEMLGGKNRASEVLARKRPLTLPMIRALSEALEIPPALLIREPSAPYDAAGRSAAAPSDRAVVADWLTRVRKRAAADAALRGRFRAGDLNEDLIRYVVRLSWMDKGPRLAMEFLAERGIAVVIEPAPPRSRIDGAALLGRSGAPVIALTLRQDRLDQFWSTLVHELVHAWKHLGSEHDQAIVDEDIETFGEDGIEREAHDLTAELLIPHAVWARSAAAQDPNEETIRALAAELQISPAIVAGRAGVTKFAGQRRLRAILPALDSNLLQRPEGLLAAPEEQTRDGQADERHPRDAITDAGLIRKDVIRDG
jgi:HTH-type transcriptional regulator/antitoxin HigA